ncbi:MAG: hypothetical protein M3506_09205 [Chloroflexota bacterium]|nr:hypothetical protein [Chloroflexota bacterium]
MAVWRLGERPQRFTVAAAFVLVLATLLCAALLLQRSSTGVTPASIDSDEVIAIEIEASYPRLTLLEKIESSERIIVGVVGESYGSRWPTPNGQLPEAATRFTVSYDDLYIHTDYPVTVEQTLKGSPSPSSAMVRVRLLGGQVGNDSVGSDEVNALSPGDRVLLFLGRGYKPLHRSGPPAYNLLMGSRTAYQVKGNEAALIIDDEQVGELSLEAVRAEIAKSRPGVYRLPGAAMPTATAGE